MESSRSQLYNIGRNEVSVIGQGTRDEKNEHQLLPLSWREDVNNGQPAKRRETENSASVGVVVRD